MRLGEGEVRGFRSRKALPVTPARMAGHSATTKQTRTSCGPRHSDTDVYLSPPLSLALP